MYLSEMESWLAEAKMKELWAGGHPPEEQIEQYVMGLMAEPEVSLFEDHVILCERCQNAVQETDAYVVSLRQALRNTAGEEPAGPVWKKWFSLPWLPVPAMGVAAAVFAAFLFWRSPAPDNWVPVRLEAMRDAVAVTAPAGKALRLDLNTTGLQPGAANASIVTSTGVEVFARPVEVGVSPAIVEVPEGLRAGRYWVRIRPSQGETMREFALLVKQP